MDRTAWKFLNPHVEGNRLVSKVQTDSGTPVGMHLYKAMIQGLIPNASTRTMGSIQRKWFTICYGKLLHMYRLGIVSI